MDNEVTGVFSSIFVNFLPESAKIMRGLMMVRPRMKIVYKKTRKSDLRVWRWYRRSDSNQ